MGILFRIEDSLSGAWLEIRGFWGKELVGRWSFCKWDGGMIWLDGGIIWLDGGIIWLEGRERLEWKELVAGTRIESREELGRLTEDETEIGEEIFKISLLSSWLSSGEERWLLEG